MTTTIGKELGAAAAYALLDLGGTGVFDDNQSTIKGTVGLVGNTAWNQFGQSVINGNVVYGAGVTGTTTGTTTVSGTISENTAAINNAATAATNAASFFKNLPATLPVSDFGGSSGRLPNNGAIAANVGYNVVDLTGLTSGGGTFDLDGPAGAEFVINVDGNIDLSGGLQFEETYGITAADVIINETDPTATVIISGHGMGTLINAIILAPTNNITLDGNVTGEVIGGKNSTVNVTSGISLTYANGLACFAAGTRILTGTSERPVEALVAGDIVLTRGASEALLAKPIKWIGWRRIDLAAHPRPELVTPIRIQRDAFADGLPHRDLLVSPDHAILVDGMLICARQLVNGTTIRPETKLLAVTYYHVELDEHGIVFAEGLASESYLDTGNRGIFANADEPTVLHPDMTDVSRFPSRETASCAPFVFDENSVRPVWDRLVERAALLGQPVSRPDVSSDAALCILAGGHTLRPLPGLNGHFRFVVPKGLPHVQLVSRAASPTDLRPWMEDRRRLGVYVGHITVQSGDNTWDIPVDHPGLTQGWWAPERGEISLRRWTDGRAVLPLPETDAPLILDIQASNDGMEYVVSVGEQPLAA